MTAIVLLLVGALSSAEAGSQTRLVTGAEAIVAVYTQDSGLGSLQGPRLIVAAWPDGYVVWSPDRIEGGPPYRSGKVDPRLLSEGLSRAMRDGVFTDTSLANPHFGPDAKFTTILLRYSGKQLRMSSWHEVSELDGRLVSRSGGLTPLVGSRLDALRKEPPQYLYYRAVWGELRALAASLIPATSNPVAGDVSMKAGVMTWVEPPAP